ncbi:TAT-variant-translocated molybdopterin oxidoreductase [soil metagenome]
MMTTNHAEEKNVPMSDSPTTARPRPEYWSTLEEYHQDDAYLARVGEEFFPAAKPETDDENALMTPMQRRTFLKLGGFAALAAALQSCERPISKIVPYTNKPEDMTYGYANYYASTCTECSAACGTLIKSREGRPIKLEGNPDHPVNRGALCARGQASVMNLYDPDRLRFPLRLNRKPNFKASDAQKFAVLDKEIAQKLRTARGKVVFLGAVHPGPSNERLMESWSANGDNFQHVSYDAMDFAGLRKSHAASFGAEVTPRYRWDRADVVLCLGGDPLAQSLSPVETQRDFAAKRIPKPEGMSRVYVFEPAPTLTGINADYRYPTHPDHLLPIGLAIAHQLLIIDGKGNGGGDARALLGEYTPEKVSAMTGIDTAEIVRVAKSLGDAAGRSIISSVGAGAQTKSAEALHLLTNFLNSALGNYETTIDISVSASRQAAAGAAEMMDLIKEMNSGAVDVLIFHGVNPVYTLPPSAGFVDALAKVKTIVSLNMKMDETTAMADYALPSVHGLESWGDAEAHSGVYSIQQPGINILFGDQASDPSYETRAWQDSLIALMHANGNDTFMRVPPPLPVAPSPTPAPGATPAPTPTPVPPLPAVLMTWYDFVRETWEEKVFPNVDSNGRASKFDDFWMAAVRKGVVDTIGDEARNGALSAPKFNAGSLDGVKVTQSEGQTVLLAQPTTIHGDGESMGNPFLMELPDPVSKICWENYASIAPSYAKSLGVKEGDHLTLEAGGAKIEIPTFIQPGMHKDVVAVTLGWGRRMSGALGDGLGVDVYPLTQISAAGVSQLSGLPVTVTKSVGYTQLANIQGHNYLYSPELAGILVNERHDPESEILPGAERSEVSNKPVYARPIIAETTFNEWKVNPAHAYPNETPQHEDAASMWERKHKYVGHHWSMSIDLNACNGCGACMVACSVENNVPVVGKDEIIKGREMFWIRIDRYYRGDKENPQFAQQPMLCQHCGNAPCETVCPVIATMHNDEGLNVMTYNRCVGTRYCANNCPYKVRRFNFWQYSNWRSGPYDDMKRVSPLELVLNPDVTVRTKGVMEKCTFCTQRIRVAKEAARDSGKPLKDGTMLTACQQTCPAKAIVFGDRNDPDSEVLKNFNDPRIYGLLADLNTDPSVRYLSLVRNRDEASPYRTAGQEHHLKHAGEEHHAGAASEGGAEHSTGEKEVHHE